MLEGEGNLRAAPSRVVRRRQGEAGAAGLDLGDEQLGERGLGLADVRHVHVLPHLQCPVQDGELHDGRRADPEPFGGHGRAAGTLHREWRIAAQPPRQRRFDFSDNVGPDMDEGRGDGASVQILVGTADGELGAG